MKNSKPWFPLLILFVLLNALIFAGQRFLANQGFDQAVLLGGNCIVFLASFLSLLVSIRSLKSTNPNAAVRSIYGSFMIKFFIIIIAAFVYIMTMKKEINKPSLFASMGLYVVYTIVETVVLQKMLRSKRNA